jgi:hypothetical protein
VQVLTPDEARRLKFSAAQVDLDKGDMLIKLTPDELRQLAAALLAMLPPEPDPRQ